MVFPVESEDRTMRNLLMMSQDHARLVVEIFRRVLVMVEGLSKNNLNQLKSSLEEIEKLHKDSLALKRNMIKELHESGSVLMNREDLYRLISKSGELMDYIEGIGYRLHAMAERKWKIPKDMLEGLVKLSDAAFETLTKLRESLISLGFNSERAITLTRDVDEGERRVDAIYIDLEMKIVSSKADLHVILVMRDIIEQIELMIDTAEEEADMIRILAL